MKKWSEVFLKSPASNTNGGSSRVWKDFQGKVSDTNLLTNAFTRFFLLDKVNKTYSYPILPPISSSWTKVFQTY